jgi:hypothetical protein
MQKVHTQVTEIKDTHHHHHHHLSVMELGHLLTHSGLMYPEASSLPWFLLPVGE